MSSSLLMFLTSGFRLPTGVGSYLPNAAQRGQPGGCCTPYALHTLPGLVGGVTLTASLPYTSMATHRTVDHLCILQLAHGFEQPCCVVHGGRHLLVLRAQLGRLDVVSRSTSCVCAGRLLQSCSMLASREHSKRHCSSNGAAASPGMAPHQLFLPYV